MRNTTPTTIRQWNEEIFQQLYQYYQGVSNMSNTGTFNIKNVMEYMRKILFNKKFNIPNEDAMKSSVLEGMITFKQDSYNAFKAFKDSIEMYIEIAMFNIQLLDKKEIVGNSLSIGKCNKRLLELLQERCRLSENEIRKLSYFIEEGETWRNIWHHNTPPKEDADVHKKGCQIALEYLFAVSAACRRIEMARGGIRFTADVTCTLDFYNGEQNRTFTYVDVNHPLQIEGKAGVYTLKITTNDKDGAKTFTREGLIKSNQYNDEKLQKDSRVHKKNKIRIAPVLNLGNDALAGIPWKQGNYLGAVNSEGQPHGIGTYIQEDKSFGGRFQNGEPQGTFIVSCPEFKYKGTIIAKNDAPWDLDEGEMGMSDTKELKFIGRFKDFCCVKGKLLVANKISYEGTFKTINGQTTVSGIGTLYLPDHLIYRGEVFNGSPHGRGCLVDEQALEVTYTDWYMGESIADELRELHIKGNEPVKLYDSNNFLCDITLKGICLNYSVEKLNLVIENDGGETLSCFNDELQKKEWTYNIKYTLEAYKAENDKYGLKNLKGKIVLTPYYDDINMDSYKDCGLIRVKKDEKYGCINNKNKIIIPIVYEEIKYISEEESFKVKLNEKYGYINIKGETIIPIEYLFLHNAWTDGLLLAQNSEREVGYLTRDNVPLFFGEYSSCSSFKEGLAPVKYKHAFRDKNYKYGNIYNKYGFINTKGEIVIPCIFDSCDWFEDGFANVVFRGVPIKISKNYAEPEIVKGDNGKFGLKNKEGKVFTSFIYDEIVCRDQFDIVEVVLNGSKGLIDYEGNVLLKPQYDYISLDVGCGRFCFVLKSNKWEPIDLRKLKDTDTTFDAVKSTGWGCFLGKKNNIWNLYDYDVKETYKKILFDYQQVPNQRFSLKGLALVKRNNKFGFINLKDRKESIVCKYDDVEIDGYLKYVFQYDSSYKTEYAKVKLEGKWGIINHVGEVVLDFDDYDYIDLFGNLLFYHNICITRKKGKYGVIFIKDSICTIVVPFIYDLIEKGQYGKNNIFFLLIKKYGKYGALDTKGKILKLCTFAEASDVKKELEKHL